VGEEASTLTPMKALFHLHPWQLGGTFHEPRSVGAGWHVRSEILGRPGPRGPQTVEKLGIAGT